MSSVLDQFLATLFGVGLTAAISFAVYLWRLRRDRIAVLQYLIDDCAARRVFSAEQPAPIDAKGDEHEGQIVGVERSLGSLRGRIKTVRDAWPPSSPIAKLLWQLQIDATCAQEYIERNPESYLGVILWIKERFDACFAGCQETCRSLQVKAAGSAFNDAISPTSDAIERFTGEIMASPHAGSSDG